MSKDIACPSCGTRATASDQAAFEVRGIFQGRPVRRCNACGVGLFVRRIGKPKLIDGSLWSRMQQSWDKEPRSQSTLELAPTTGRGNTAPVLGEKVTALLNTSLPSITPDTLSALFVSDASRVQSGDFDLALVAAVDYMARGLGTDQGLDSDAIRREIGSYLMTGYIVGRRLLNSHHGALRYSRSDEAEGNALRLVSCVTMLDDDDAFSEVPAVAAEWLHVYANYFCEMGELGGLADRSYAAALAGVALHDGALLAIAECEIFV